MNLQFLTKDLAVGPQITTGELAFLKAAGIRSIVCNRPDGEEADQTDFPEMAKAAHQLGINLRYVPVVPNTISPTDIAEFADALEELPKPMLAYCRTGTRSAMLWALCQAGRIPAADILAAAEKAGFDLSALSARLEKR